MATLLSYRDRYGEIVELAGLEFQGDLEEVEIVERVEGNATTDFGAPGAHFAWDEGPVDPEEMRAAGLLLDAAYRRLDFVAAHAPDELRKGPRGGGRDRDAVVAHVVAANVEYGRKLGLARIRPETARAEELHAHRQAIVDVFLGARDGERRTERGWPLRYAARRGIWHVLDHVWEIEDRSE